MITQKLRKVGNSYVVTIPKSEVERQNLKAGQLLIVEVQAAEVRPLMSLEVAEAFDESWKANEKAYRYLSKR